MKIDYSVDESSKYFLYLDVSYRQAANHLWLAIYGNQFGIATCEKIKHVGLGVIKCIPVIGQLVTLIDTFSQRNISVVKIGSNTPFARGLEHGKVLKNRIKEIYDPILHMLHRRLYNHEKALSECINILLINGDDEEVERYRTKKNLYRDRLDYLEKNIPEDLKEEMQGLASGSGYSYQDVVLVHSFLDMYPGIFGCTAMGVKKIEDGYARVAADNDGMQKSGNRTTCTCGSKCRRKAFLEAEISEDTPFENVLKTADMKETVQAMVFDISQGDIFLSSSTKHAASKKLKKFSAKEVFGSNPFQKDFSCSKVRLYRNLDWSWGFLGQETVVLIREHLDGKKTASITWPGYIGSLSGMNNAGLAAVLNQCGCRVNSKGYPDGLLLTHMLDTCNDIEQATHVIEQKKHGSSANLIVADKTASRSYELGEEGGFKRIGEILAHHM